VKPVRAIGLRVLLLTVVAFAVSQASASAGALTLNPIGQFAQPTYLTSEPDPGRLLVTQRLGEIKLVANGQVSTFADLTSLVACPQAGCEGERGLMSVALAPDFASTGHLYVDYIDNPGGQIHVAELTAQGDAAPLSSLRPVLAIDHSDAANHNGGQLQFGPEGDLYISTGDGGGSNDEFHNSQDLSSLLGKILRIDPRQSGSAAYGIPAGNPFPGSAAPADTIWSYGLRNPFRFSFDRLSGDLVIGDVGQGAREEIDFAPRSEGGGAGANWGWNCREGFIAGPETDLPAGQCAAGNFAEPVFDYPHVDPEDGTAHGCAIIGGYVVRDQSLGDLYGRYVYGDLCTGEIRSLELPTSGQGTAGGDRSEGLTVEHLSSFGEDSCGRVYAVSLGGTVSRLEGPAPADCSAKEPPTEPPTERPPTVPPPTGEPFIPTGPAPVRIEVRLRPTRRLVAPGRGTALIASVSPCSGLGGQRVVLNRGGARLRSARLNNRCVARFWTRVAHRSTFRVLMPGGAEYLSGRSDRVTIHVAGRRGVG
jgi:glucose/sorbosone dehydrogenase